MGSLDRLTAAVDAYEAAGRTVRREVARAKAGGAEVAAIAAAAHVTRQTIYRWLAEAEADATVDVADSLDDALQLLAELVSPGSAAEVRKRIGRSTASRILGITIGTRNLPPGVLDRLTDEERSIITVGRAAATAAERVHTATGEWPHRVRLD